MRSRLPLRLCQTEDLALVQIRIRENLNVLMNFKVCVGGGGGSQLMCVRVHLPPKYAPGLVSACVVDSQLSKPVAHAARRSTRTPSAPAPSTSSSSRGAASYACLSMCFLSLSLSLSLSLASVTSRTLLFASS
jgi:hypothetical protein